MKAIIRLDVPDWQIGQEVSIYFPDTMSVKGIVELDDVLDEIRAEIEPKCDRINSLASVLPYTAHREIQELLCEIMNLCKAESEDNG